MKQQGLNLARLSQISYVVGLCLDDGHGLLVRCGSLLKHKDDPTQGKCNEQGLCSTKI